MDVQNIDRVAAFITKDGSEIRELLAHRNSSIRNQSLAEARLPPGGATIGHRHLRTEEIYYILEGEGRMELAGDRRRVGPGDAIAIPPGRVPSDHQCRHGGTEVPLLLRSRIRALRHGLVRFRRVADIAALVVARKSLRFIRRLCPGGALEDSPAVHCWGYGYSRGFESRRDD